MAMAWRGMPLVVGVFGEKKDVWQKKRMVSYHTDCAKSVYGHCDLYRLFPQARDRGEIMTTDEISIRRFQSAVCCVCKKAIWLPGDEIAARLTITIGNGATEADRWRLKQFPWVKPEPFDGVFFAAQLPMPLTPAIERLPFVEAIRYGRPEDIAGRATYWYSPARLR